jgi:hypothetical protein
MMKALSLLFWSAAMAVALSTSLFSQAPAEAAPTKAVAQNEKLQKIKAENAKLIEKQAATLRKLDELAKEAQQLKIFGSRS